MIEDRMDAMARELLIHLNLSKAQASVLLDESRHPRVFRVYVFDRRLAHRTWHVESWQGYRVEIVHSEPARPLLPH